MPTTNPGELLHGQELRQQGTLPVAYTEQVMDNRDAEDLVGNALTEVVPLDGNSSRVKVFDIGVLDSIYYGFPVLVNLNLPNVLRGLTATYNASHGDGESIHDPGAALSYGQTGGINMTADGGAQASAATIPDLQVDIYEPPVEDIPGTQLLFYIEGPTTDIAAIILRIRAILTRTVSQVVAGSVVTTLVHGLVAGQPFTFLTLTGAAGGIAVATTYYVLTATSLSLTYALTPGGATVNTTSATGGTLAPTVSEWPNFNPLALSFTLNGQQVSVNRSANSGHNDRWGLTDDELTSVSYYRFPYPGYRSDSISQEVGVTVRSMRIPPTIHGAITITGASEARSATVVATANLPAITGTGGAPSYASITNGPHTKTVTATASVSPTSVAATPGITAIPTYGLYVWRVETDLTDFGTFRVAVILINFNRYA